MNVHMRLAATACWAVLGAAGCASTNVDAQWRSTELAPAYLRGATVLVSCETGEDVLKRICEDRVAADLRARGVRVVEPTPGSLPAVMPPSGTSDMQYIPAARDSGAKAVVSVAIGPAVQAVNQGFSIGIGGFGFGRGGGGGVGVSAPIGGGRVDTGYAANGRVTDVASGRLMWSARASAPPSSDLNAQLAELSKSVVDAAAGAGLF